MEFFYTPAPAHSNYIFSPTQKEKEKRQEKDGRKTVFKSRRLVLSSSSVEDIFSEEFISNCFIPLFCRNLIGDFDKK